jgi:uncharacterized membrane protein YgdD (TMEM256/DUF423 family)
MVSRIIPLVLIALGAFSAASSVGLSAAIAHLPAVAAGDVSALNAALQVQQFHALSLLILGLLMVRTGATRLLTVAGFLFVAGTLLFSGNIYLRVLSGFSLFRPLVPYGGGALILAWLVMALGAMLSPLNPILSDDMKSTNPGREAQEPLKQIR